jgi:hypothetical protein
MDAYPHYLDHDEELDNLLGNHCLLSLRYPKWTLFVVLTFGIFIQGTKKPEFSPENSGADRFSV